MEVVQLPTELELEKEAEWFAQILERGPRRETYDVGAHVCQICRELMFFESADERLAAISETGEFVGFGPEHVNCSGGLSPHFLACRRHRRCEVCRASVPADESHRCGHFWICETCEREAAHAGHPTGAVLRDLAYRRSTIRGRLGQREPAEPPDYELGLKRIVRPLPGWLPDGLALCRDCGKVRGTSLRPAGSGETDAWRSTCLCEGLTCRECGRRRVRRPISDYFDPVAGGWWHVPYFVGMSRTCDACNRE